MEQGFGQRARAFCTKIGIDYPLIQAPMAGGWTTPELVAAVSGAGGLGMVAASRITADQLKGVLEKVRALTDRPFGVNFLLPRTEPFEGSLEALQSVLNEVRKNLNLPSREPETPQLPPSYLEAQLDLVLEFQVPVVSFAMGIPGPWVNRLKEAGVLLIEMVTTVAEALELQKAGADVIIAQGADAGGHRATIHVAPGEEVPLIGTMALVPQVVDAVELPVIAAGGIMDGRGLTAALALGASGVQMGTRFLTAIESGAFPEYRARLVKAADTDTVITWGFTGRPARSLRTPLLDLLKNSGLSPLPFPHQAAAAEDIYRTAVQENVGDYAPLLAGQAAGLARADQSAAEIVAEVIREARQVLTELNR